MELSRMNYVNSRVASQKYTQNKEDESAWASAEKNLPDMEVETVENAIQNGSPFVPTRLDYPYRSDLEVIHEKSPVEFVSMEGAYPSYASNTSIKAEDNEGDSGRACAAEYLPDMEVEIVENSAENSSPFMLTLVDYQYRSHPPEVIDQKSTVKFVKNLSMREGLWRNVLINGDVSSHVVAAIQRDIAYVYIGAKATQNAIKAIPSHILIVKICEGVNPRAVAAIPKTVCTVFIESGVSPATVKSLPKHITIAVVEDLTCWVPLQARSIATLGEKLQKIKDETHNALPRHVTLRPNMDEIIIGRDKSTSHYRLEYTYVRDVNARTIPSNVGSLNNSTETNRLFDAKHSSALKVINVDATVDMLNAQIINGWRWVTPKFISDMGYNEKSSYSGYRVEEVENEPAKHDFIRNDFVVNSNITVNSNFSTFTPSYFINRETNERELVFTHTNDTETIKSLLDAGHNLSIKSNNPVVKSKQIPTLSLGDWVIMQGKTMRLIKAGGNNELEKSLYEKLECKLEEIKTTDNSKENAHLIYPGELPVDFFKDTYSRLAGAYLRRLERLPKLQEAYQRFFSMTETNLASGQNLSVTYSGSELSYTQFYNVELKNSYLTPDDLELLHQALGIRIDPKENATIANTIPFKKVLEILSSCNTVGERNLPLLVNLKMLGKENVQFLLSPTKKNENQLLVSTCTDTLRFHGENRLTNNGKLKFIAHAYTTYFQDRDKTSAKVVPPINAKMAHSILENPIAQSKPYHDWQLMIEFLVCTQLVEAHFTPGKLENSRVPGSNKLARSLIKKAVADKSTSLTKLFNITKSQKEFFPMAGEGGSGNGRNAVDTLNRNKPFVTYRKNLRGENNAPDYDMSEDSDV